MEASALPPRIAAPMDSSPAAASPAEPGTAELLAQLREDRLWLLRQLDSGRWSEWRLDLAALERELGQLLDLAADRLGSS
jgi:hypothetical protein